PKDSPIRTLSDLAGKTVCATRKSTSIAELPKRVPDVKMYPVDVRSDCLVALQQARVDAITSDDTVLASFQAQDQVANTRMLPPFNDQPYAIAMRQGNEDLVEFVNAVLDRMRSDGSLENLYAKWLGANRPSTPPEAEYR